MIHTMTPLEKMVLARALVEEPENWCQGTYARNDKGHPVLEDFPDSVCFCMAGACRLACANASLLHCALPYEQCHTSIPNFNDSPTTTHADVLAVFDRAIDRLLTGNDCYCP